MRLGSIAIYYLNSILYKFFRINLYMKCETKINFVDRVVQLKPCTKLTCQMHLRHLTFKDPLSLKLDTLIFKYFVSCIKIVGLESYIFVECPTKNYRWSIVKTAFAIRIIPGS